MGKLAGKAGSSTSRAAGPPVETPMSSTEGLDRALWDRGAKVETLRAAVGATGATGSGGRADRGCGLSCAGEGENLGNKLQGKGLDGSVARCLPGGLGDIVGGSAGQGLDGGFGAALSKRAAHDDRGCGGHGGGAV